MTSPDYTAYIAGLPKVLAGAACLFRDADGRILLVEPNYREGWALPGGTVESDGGETPREAARRETREEIGLDVEPGALLAVDWVRGPGRPPLVAYVSRRRGAGRGAVPGDPAAGVGAAVLEAGGAGGGRCVPPGALGPRVRAALDALAAGTGPAELVDGRPER